MRSVGKFGKFALLLLIAASIHSCAAIEQMVAPLDDYLPTTRVPEPAYEVLFPHYVRVCAVTQYRPRNGSVGGSPGHAVMYIKGACRDEDAAYPRLRPCAQEIADPFSEQHGAGISVNKVFKNVNWMATPGHRMFFDGDLEPTERLTQERYDEVMAEAVAAGLFRGIEIHDEYLAEKPEGESLEAFVAANAIGTDFALRFARSTYCTQLPLSDDQTRAVIDYLNGLNDEYASGRATYNWSGYHDNCVHTLHNALAAAGVWQPKSVRVIKARQFFNLAVPANTVIDLAALANLADLEKPAALYGDPVYRRTIETGGWLPMHHGALVNSIAIHQDNDLYETQGRLLILSGWFGMTTNDKALLLLTDARSTELEANLRRYRSRYESILAGRGEARRPWFAGEEYDVFEARYYEYIEVQLADVQSMLSRLNEARFPLSVLDPLRNPIRSVDSGSATWLEGDR